MRAPSENAQGHALARFFDQTTVPIPGTGSILAIRSASTAGLSGFEPESITCLQTERRHATMLERAGLKVVSEVSGVFDLCLIEATRDREENLYHIALGWSLLSSGGTLVLSAANTLGAETLGKKLRDCGLPIVSVYSKAKCRVIALTRTPGDAAEPPSEWLALGAFQEIPGTGIVAGPGMFSAHAIDAGTRLLCDALDAPLTGRGADFGAGYGALSRHVLERSPALHALDLYESEAKALAAARCNLAAWEDHVALGYHWSDLTVAAPTQRYDWIVMNPPFHAGSATEPALGQQFIATAANSLSPRGTLWLVANRRLPYESILSTRFTQVVDLGQTAGYKVYRASHPLDTRHSGRSPRPASQRGGHRAG
jgi:16S rRNA (guanine1207-N2)-methyltransferase